MLCFTSIAFVDVRHIAYSLSIGLGNGWSASLQGVGQFFYILLMVVLVAVLAYYTTRLLGSARMGKFGRRNLQIVESMGVGPQVFVHVLRVGKKYVLVGVTKNHVSQLSELAEEDLKLDFVEDTANFDSIFSRFQRRSEEENTSNAKNANEGSDKER